MKPKMYAINTKAFADAYRFFNVPPITDINCISEAQQQALMTALEHAKIALDSAPEHLANGSNKKV